MVGVAQDVLWRRKWGASEKREVELLQRTPEVVVRERRHPKAGVTPALAYRTAAGHCTKSRTAEDSAQNRYSPLLAQAVGWRHQGTCFAAAQLAAIWNEWQSAQASLRSPTRLYRPNGQPFPSRRCAPRALRADYCRMILSSREVVSQESNGVEKRVYEYIWMLMIEFLATYSF